jgi:AmmeMemoRadiSam system protein A
MDTYVKLAYDTIKMYLEKNELPDTKNTDVILQKRKAGCFVTLHKKNGELKGCVGTINPTYKNLAGEIIGNAISASQHDPRFPAVTLDELDDLEINVDVLNPPERIESEKELDVKKYGVIVQTPDGRDGLLLPDIEGIDDVKSQIEIARQKAGIAPDELISLYRFIVERHK